MTRQIPRGPEGLICPLHKKSCETTCHKCPWWLQLRGTHPATGEAVDRWECAIAANVMMTQEAAAQARQNGAATESMRNEMVRLAQRPRTPVMIEGH